jgi:opacity protein-like surface antigen
MCASAVVSPVAAIPENLEMRWTRYAVGGMKLAIEKCDYFAWLSNKRDYDTYASLGAAAAGFSPPPAPPYPFPCYETRKLRTTNVRTPPAPPEPVRLYQVIPPTFFTPGRSTANTALGPSNFSGLYLEGHVTGNLNMLRQTEIFEATRVVTNEFSDSSNVLRGGFGAGYLVPLGKNFLIGPTFSVDFLNQDTNHNFPGGFFLGQTINTIVTVGGQAGFVPLPNLFVYGEVGAAFVSVTQKLNFLGPVTTADNTVTGLNLGIGAAFQPINWQIAGNPVTMFVQYNDIILPDADFNNAGNSSFIYRNRNDFHKINVGFRVLLDAINDDYNRRGISQTNRR